jgi:hypothetical protein
MPLRFVDTDDDAPDAAVDPDDPPADPPGADPPDADDDPPAPAPDADDDPEDASWAPPIGAPDNVVSAATILTAKARVANSPLRRFDVITPPSPRPSAVRQQTAINQPTAVSLYEESGVSLYFLCQLFVR